MEEGAVADVLHPVRHVGERRTAQPLRALPAHLAVADRAAVGPQDHRVTADAATDRRPSDIDGGAVVRAAAAERRPSRRHRRDRQQLTRNRRRGRCGQPLAQTRAQDRRQPFRSQLAVGGYDGTTAGVTLADQCRLRGCAVQRLSDEQLDEGALLLDDEHLADTAGCGSHDVVVERVDQPESQQPDSCAAHVVISAQAEVGQRLADLAVGPAGGHDRDPCVGRVDLDDVELVGSGIRERGRVTPVVELALELEGVRQEQHRPLRERPRHSVELQLREHRLQPVGVNADLAEAVRDRRDDLHAGPAPGVTRQLIAVPPEVQHLLRCAGSEDRHAGVIERHFAAVRKRRGLRRRVVARSRDHAATAADAVQVGMPESVSAAVDTGSLAVPHADQTVVPRERCDVVLLTAPDRRCGDVLVDAGKQRHVVVGEKPASAREGEVERPQRRPLVAADERPGAPAGATVGAELVEDHADQRLYAGKEHAARGRFVAVGQVDRSPTGRDRHRQR